MKRGIPIVKQETSIIFTDVIDTPYPYCIIPKKHFRSHDLTNLSSEIEKSTQGQSIKVQPSRSLLSVTTWDGRELFDLSSVIK